MTYFLGPRFTGGLDPPCFINYILSPYDSYVTQLHFFSEFETSPPPIKLTFCTEFALFRKRVNGQTLFFEAKSFCPRI